MWVTMVKLYLCTWEIVIECCLCGEISDNVIRFSCRRVTTPDRYICSYWYTTLVMQCYR